MHTYDVGIGVGADVGAELGAAVGAGDGAGEGADVGSDVGVADGAEVGAGVGAGVGPAVHRTSLHASSFFRTVLQFPLPCRQDKIGVCTDRKRAPVQFTIYLRLHDN